MDVLVKGPLVVEEKMIDLSGTEGDHAKFGDDQVTQEGDSFKSFLQSPKDSSSKQVSNPHGSERSSTDTISNPSSSSNPTELNINVKDELESTRAEMGEVREENERLKSVLAKILKDYQSLQSQIVNTIHNEQGKTSCSTGVKTGQLLNWTEVEVEEEEEEGDDLVSLSLGTRSLIGQKINGEDHNKPKVGSPKTIKDEMNLNEGLSLGLDLGLERSNTGTTTTTTTTTTAAATEQKSNYFTPDNNSIEDRKDESQPSNKIPKSASPRSADDHFSQQLHVKKARVSVRARCDAPTMSDGCQWRKYGQKISKGNPCPRAYYRCTVAPACPVRKQVQRCADDMSILITTYEGTHNHPLPMAATAMASTTSAAASMLTSGPTAARPGITTPMSMTHSMPNPALNGLNFNVNSDNTSSSASRQPYYLQSNPNFITASPHFPTITLDLTSPSSNPTPPSSSLSSSSAQFNRFSNYTSSGSTAPRYSTNFNFSSMDSTITSHVATPNYLGFSSHPMIPRQSTIPHEVPFYYQQQPSSLQKPTITSLPSSSGHADGSNNGNLTDTIAEAITTDPSFQSALAAAITSIVSGGNGKEGVVVSEGLTQTSKWGSSGSSTITSSASNNTSGSNGNVNGCTPSFLNRPTAANQRMQGNMMFLGLPSMGFSNAKGTSSASHGESSEHMN